MSSIQYFWKTPDIAKEYTHAVSLHGHTLYSREGLNYIFDRVEQIAVLRWALQSQMRRCANPKMDLSRAFWTPPLTPRGAFEAENGQIENVLGLSGMVSITDHDTIEAPLRLRLLAQTRHTPISLEWTVPFEGTQVHLGIHNLPSSSARRWLSEMLAYSNEARNERLRELLAELSSIKDLLIVLNHPLWDLCSVGPKAHWAALEHFLLLNNRFLHAFELGGLRGWTENQKVVDLANTWKQLVISGGDRHGREPNAVLNLTRAKSFDEFVKEIRRERKSSLIFMPQYRQSLKLRILRTANDAVRHVAGHPLGANWEDRTFQPDSMGEFRALSRLWQKTPVYLRILITGLRWLESESIRVMERCAGFASRNEFRFRPLGEDADAA